MLSKRISKETDIRMTGAELSSLLGIFIHMQGNKTPVTEETKKKIAYAIKDYCDTIIQYIDLF